MREWAPSFRSSHDSVIFVSHCCDYFQNGSQLAGANLRCPSSAIPATSHHIAITSLPQSYPDIPATYITHPRHISTTHPCHCHMTSLPHDITMIMIRPMHMTSHFYNCQSMYPSTVNPPLAHWSHTNIFLIFLKMHDIVWIGRLHYISSVNNTTSLLT